MTALPDLPPEVRAAIARLCGGEFREGSLRTALVALAAAHIEARKEGKE